MRQLLKNTFALALTLVFTSGMAFGQVTNITQISNQNDATVEQSDGDDVADVLQNGIDNEATALQGGGSYIEQIQVGNNNEALGSHSGDTYLTQEQRGNRNEAYAWAESDATVTQEQFGSENFARVGQSGEKYGPTTINQNSDVRQFQSGNRNVAEIEVRQGNGRKNSFEQRQIGNSNTSKILDVGSGNAVTQIQDGNSNVSVVGSRDADPQLGGADVFTEQRGHRNSAIVGGGVGSYDATIQQFGNDNTATVTQN
jgi:hypothetical protein